MKFKNIEIQNKYLIGVVIILASIGLILCCIAGYKQYNQIKSNKKVIQLQDHAKKLDDAANDSSIQIRNNVIKSESVKRETKIKSYYEKEQKSIKNLHDSVVIMHQFIRMVTTIKNSNH